MAKIYIFIFIIILLPGCSTTRRALESARDTIDQLERSNEERRARNIELESLYTAERDGNQKLERILSEKQSELDEYFESEKRRAAAEKLIIESLSGIFGEGSSIVEQLQKGYNEIRKYFETEGFLD